MSDERDHGDLSDAHADRELRRKDLFDAIVIHHSEYVQAEAGNTASQIISRRSFANNRLQAAIDRFDAAARAEERKVCWHKEFETRGIIAEAVRKEERERVWRKVYAAAKKAPVMRTDSGQQLGKAFVLDEIKEAALADGVELGLTPGGK